MSIEIPGVILREVPYPPNPDERMWTQQALAAWLLDIAVQVEFPETDASTVPTDVDRSKVHSFGYVGPDFLALPQKMHPYRYRLTRAYLDSAAVWSSLGITTRPLGESERSSEVFLVNRKYGQSADAHYDTRYTAAFYPYSGAALIVTHDKSVSTLDDLIQAPSTLVLPKAGTMVYFDGTTHAHQGIDPGIHSSYSVAEKAAKVREMLGKFNVVRIVQNLGLESSNPCENGIHLGNLNAEVLGEALVAPEWLNGHRIVGSFNFYTPGGSSSLDEFFQQATRTT